MNIIQMIAGEFNVKESQVENTVALIDEGNTIPFIARYRKEVTGGLSDEVLRDIDERLTYLRNLQERKDEVIRLIDEQGKLNDELRAQIDEAEVLQRVEDLYKPYKKKKATRASKAKEKGLEPLALIFREQQDDAGSPEELAAPFIDHEKGVETVEDAISGACDIIAEMISDDPDITAAVRERTYETAAIKTEAVDAEEKTVYDMYYEYREAVRSIPNHRILAINRGEKEKKLKVKISADAEKMEALIGEHVIIDEGSPFTELLRDTITDAYKRLMAPSAEREIRSMLTERAEAEAVKVFAKNTEKLLMVPPVKGARIISIDPGYRTGCKVAVINETGKLLAYTTVFPTEPKKDIKGTEAVLGKLADKFKINTIVIGNGTASRETEEVVADFIRKSGRDIHYTIVNEAGASVYSASKLAHVAGINMGIARNIVAYREEKGAFKKRSELKNVSKLGEKTFNQCAGFIRVSGGDEPLDATSVHPESYKAAEAMLAKLGMDKEELRHGGIPDIDERVWAVYGEEEKTKAGRTRAKSLADLKALSQKAAAEERKPKRNMKKAVEKMAADLGIGVPTLSDIIGEMKKPGRDPREDAPPVVFRNDVRSFDDLEVGMELEGTVRNVVDFGAFVDIGVKNDGLVHISQLSSKFVKHPMDVVSVGDTVKVKIITIDRDKQKIGLTMKLK